MYIKVNVHYGFFLWRKDKEMNNYTNSNMQGFQLTPEDTFLPNYTDSDSPPWFISAKNNERRIISLRCVSKLLSKSRSPVVFIPLHVFPLFWNLTSKNSSHYYCKLPFSYEVCISIYIDYPRKRPWFHGSKKKYQITMLTMSNDSKTNSILIWIK